MAKKSKRPADHYHLMGVVVLLAGFSLYALASFFMSTNKYVDNMQASVIGADVDNVQHQEEVYEIFTDLKSDSRFATEVEAVKNLGLVSGYEDGSLGVDLKVNRAEFLKVVADAVDADFSGASYENCFEDVTDQWFAVFVCYAADQKWVSGYGDEGFRPADEVSFPEALKIALEAFNFSVPEEVDQMPLPGVEAGSWYAPYVTVAVNEGILGDGLVFNIENKLTRLEMVVLIYRVMLVQGLV